MPGAPAHGLPMTPDLQRKTDALAEAAVLTSPSDPPALAALHLAFKGIPAECPEASRATAERISAWAAGLLEAVILDESRHPAADMERVCLAAGLLQSLICHGTAPEDLRMPPGLEPAGPADALLEAGPGQPEDAADPDPSLLSDFVQESKEHLETADLKLMALESQPEDAEAVNAVFRAFHTIKGVAGFLGLLAVQAFAHETEDLLDKVRSGRIPLSCSLLDVVFEAVDALKKRIAWLAVHGGAAYPAEARKAMAHVQARVKAVSHGEAVPASRAPARPQACAETRAETSAAARPSGEAQPAAQQGGGPAGEGGARAGNAMKETVKVEADRLDRLLDTIGELVIAESMIFQSRELRDLKSPALAQQMAQLDKITRELQTMGTSLRMVPIRPVFQKMARLVRDLSRKAGKDVEFICAGEETELDKTVVDRIGDPLVHMVRNSVDHGIEPDAAARIEAGKPERARVTLTAFQKGGSVCIRIEDDGRGLNRESILRKARERGLLADDGSSLQDQDVWRFIFEAGFSTAAQVTEISGRGVGMDVVRRNIEELRGRIEIESRPGQGTVFSIWLPLTLAIIDGMIVRAGGQRFVFPTLSIVRIVPLDREGIMTVEGRGEMLLLQDELIPLLRMDGLDGRRPARAGAGGPRLAVVVETGDGKAGLPVDELLGQQQVVIKGLGTALDGVPGVTGGAILADGSVGLILDVDGLVRALRAAPAAAVTDMDPGGRAAGKAETGDHPPATTASDEGWTMAEAIKEGKHA